MNILMMTNTFLPHVGGVARSIDAFSNEYRRLGHNVKVIAPTFKDMDEHEKDVIRIPAIKNFNKSSFSVALPIPGIITSAMKEFMPDVIHSHHPFLIGSSALRIAHTYQIPLVFTHHTKYEEYTHYVPGDSELLKQFVINLSTNYANLCDLVFTPSESICELIKQRGVTTKTVTLPTGVDTRKYTHLNGKKFRQGIGIPEDAYVIGHLGRLAKEKNLKFLSEAIANLLLDDQSDKKYCFLLVGTGPMKSEMLDYFDSKGLSKKIFSLGLLNPEDVVNAYHAMDIFAFSSKSETPGMVITEAMAAGTPVVAIDAPGVREVVKNSINGKLLFNPSTSEFSEAMFSIATAPLESRQEYSKQALITADEFSLARSVEKALKQFEILREQSLEYRDDNYDVWTSTMRLIESDWERLKEIATAAEAAIKTTKNI